MKKMRCDGLFLVASLLLWSCVSATTFTVGSTLVFYSLSTTTTFQTFENASLVSPVVDLTFSNVALNVSQFVEQNSTTFLVKSTGSSATATVKLNIPKNYVFSTLTVVLSDGSIVVSNGTASGNLRFDICPYSTSVGSIQIQQRLAVSYSGYFCAKSSIAITGLAQGTTRGSFNVTSDSINVVFSTPFSGKYNVLSPVAASISGNCNTTEKSCRFANSITYGGSTFVANSPNLVTVNFGTANSGIEPDAVDYVRSIPPPTYVTTSPPLSITYSSPSNFIFMSQWGSGSGDRYGNATNFQGTVRCFVPTYWDSVWWWGYTQSLPSLRPGIPYTIFFYYRQDAANSPSFNKLNATVVLLKSTPTGTILPFAQNDTSKTILSLVPSPMNYSYTSFTKYTASFTVPSIYLNSYIAIRFDNPARSGPAGLAMYFANITISAPSVPITPPTPITKDSELVNLRKAPAALDSNPRSGCPHKRTGLALWHNPATWGGAVPAASTPVITIPANTAVLATAASFSSDIYQKIVVPVGSELIFEDSPINLNIKYIEVRGKFWMGSTTCRLFSEITVTFFGNKTENGILADKGIFVAPGASIDVHGKQFHYSWTRLAASVLIGDDKAYVLDDVNWEVGQQVVIATSVYKDEINPQNEVMTIKAKSGKLLQFTTSFQYSHYGGQEYQAEIGLLTRRIVFQGAEDSIPYRYGGHVMCMGTCRYAGLRTFRMGQRNILGHYPLHFHLAGYSNSSFLKDCSFQRSYFRCVSIHGTHESLVTRNVAFDIDGHCYYIEDGNEENNTISYNLAVHVHTIYANASGPAQTGEVYYTNANLEQPADTAASGFYITNAYNRIFGNAASGGWAGYAFPNLPKPIGNAANVSMVPQSRTTLEFDGNSAHSAGYFWANDGACIYCGGRLQILTPPNNLQYDTGRYNRATTGPFMRWTNIKTFLCNMGVLHWGNKIEIDTYESHDTRHTATLFGETLITNSIMNGKSNNSLQTLGAPTGKQGFQFYDTGTKTILTNIQFRNYLPNGVADPYSNNYAIISMTHSDIFKPSGISALRNVSFADMPRSQRIGHKLINTGSSRMFNFMDWDGTMTGRGKHTIVGSGISWWNFDNTCTLDPDWKVYLCDKGNREITYIQFIIPGLIASTQYGTFDPVDQYKIGNMSLWGNGITDFRYMDFTRNPGVSGVTGTGWFLYMPAGTPTNFTLTLWQIPFNTSVYLALKYPVGTTFNIYHKYKYATSLNYNFTAVTTMQQLVEGNSKNYFFDSSHLYLKLKDFRVTATNGYFERSGVRIYNMDGGLDLFIFASCPGSYQTENNTYCPSTNTPPAQVF